MGPQIKQIAVTYVTHRWVLAVFGGWMLLVVAPQVAVGAIGSDSQLDRVPLVSMIVGFPLLFFPSMLVIQAKAQFAHSRRRLVPGFAGPHLAVLAALLVVLVLVYPLLVAACLRIDPLGMAAWSAAIAASTIWAAHTNRFLGMLVGLAVFYSTMTSAGASWWILDAPSHRPIHAAIFVTGIALVAGWLWRLSRLREEMDDYQSLIQWRMARKSGTEVAEQRRIVAEAFRRHRLAAWIGDAWLARLGGYHGGSRFGVARLLRYGFGQPAEIQGLMMTIFFFAFTFFMVKYSFTAKDPGFGGITFYLMFAMMFPGLMPGEMLAQRRPRIAVELMRPLDRRQLVDGLLAATGWNAAAMWVVMNAGLVLQAYYFVPADQWSPALVGMMLFLSASATLAMAGTTMRTAVWPSQLKRMIVVWVAAMALVPPLIGWQLGREKYGDWPFFAVALLFVAFAAWMVTRARRAWMNLELG